MKSNSFSGIEMCYKITFKKIFIIFLLMMMFIPCIIADSDTFNTMVITVTPGIDGFGFELFPLGTRWRYYIDCNLFPNLTHPTGVLFDFEFILRNNGIDHRFSWKDGTPMWSMRENEVNGDIYPDISRLVYFNPRGRIYFSMDQGFGINRKSGAGPMFRLTTTLNSRYAIALERIDVIPSSDTLIFVNEDGSSKFPFGPNSIIPGFPWLQDSRCLFNNRLALSLDFYHLEGKGLGASNGISANLSVDVGPHWLANNLGINGVTSDFWKVSGSLSQTLNLLNIKQDNGLNWVSVNLGHSNSLSYTGGPVVPEDMMPVDRFRGAFNDNLYLLFTGPQFIAWDCYSELQLSLSNSILFGHVANEVSQQSYGVELLSGIHGWLHLRLFGFMHFDYSFGYNFAGGIWQSYPGWYQDSQFSFYISL